MFHATDDCQEVREKVFRLLKKSDFTFYCIVARKKIYLEKSLTSNEEEVVEEKVEVQKVEEKVDKTDQKPIRHRKRSKTSSSHRGERKLF